ncbi:MAG: preprotein translocase subunit SecG [Alistipes sp.]|nr:preprotein translocase subunit SecG [Alistipes sp.]MBQ8775545.1 preprotein translocase subunit SecG [Alistipes sp.]
MYTFCIIMITIASILLILAVLVQAPKSGMAANFGAANQTMGVRQTTDFLEKFTWAMVAAIVFFSLLSVTAYPTQEVVTEQSAVVEGALNAIAPEEVAEDLAIEGEAVEAEAEVAEVAEEAPAVEE